VETSTFCRETSWRRRRRAGGAQSGARCRQFWLAARKKGSSACSGLTTIAMRLKQWGHFRNGPVLSCLMRGLPAVGSQAAPFSPGCSEYRIFLQQGHRKERWLMSVVAATAAERNICRHAWAG
jgi:hypothetical protein